MVEFSEEISPIFDSKPRLSRDLACPILKYSIQSIFYSISSYQRQIQNKSMQQWKTFALLKPKSEETQIKNSIQYTHLKLKVLNDSFNISLKTTLHKSFLSIIEASEVLEFEKKNYESQSNTIRLKKNELETIEIQEKQESLTLIELKKKVHEFKRKEEEYKENENYLKSKQSKNNTQTEAKLKEINKKIHDITIENSELQEKFIAYELNFNTYVAEMEDLLKKSKSDSTISPIKAKIH